MITTKAPIIVIDDDIDDQEIMQHAIRELGIKNEIIYFSLCTDALDYLTNHTDEINPFIILSDINLPKMNGIELKKKIDENERLRRKSIPFIFLSTAYDKKILEQAYEHRVQGYFLKGSTMAALKETLSIIFRYWSMSKHPNAV